MKQPLIKFALILCCIVLCSGAVCWFIVNSNQWQIAKLTNALESPDEGIREQALEQLIRTGPKAESVLPTLIQMAREGSPSFPDGKLYRAIGAVGVQSEDQILIPLTQGMRNPDPEIRKEAAAALFKNVKNLNNLHPHLRELFRKKNPYQLEALQLVDRYPTGMEPLVTDIMFMLNSKEGNEVTAAEKSLMQILGSPRFQEDSIFNRYFIKAAALHYGQRSLATRDPRFINPVQQIGRQKITLLVDMLKSPQKYGHTDSETRVVIDMLGKMGDHIAKHENDLFNLLQEPPEHLEELALFQLIWRASDQSPKRLARYYLQKELEKPNLHYSFREVLIKCNQTLPVQTFPFVKGLLNDESPSDLNKIDSLEPSQFRQELIRLLIPGLKNENLNVAHICLILLPSGADIPFELIPDLIHYHLLRTKGYYRFNSQSRSILTGIPLKTYHELLKDDQLEIRGFAATVLLSQEVKSDPVLEIAAEVMRSKNAELKANMLRELRMTRSKDKASSEQFSRMIHQGLIDPDFKVRQAAIPMKDWITETPEEVFTFYEVLEHSKVPAERSQALRVLLGHPEWSEQQKSDLLNKHLHDENEQVRLIALHHLLQIQNSPSPFMEGFKHAYRLAGEDKQRDLQYRINHLKWSEEDKKKVLAFMQSLSDVNIVFPTPETPGKR